MKVSNTWPMPEEQMPQPGRQIRRESSSIECPWSGLFRILCALHLCFNREAAAEQELQLSSPMRTDIECSFVTLLLALGAVG